MVYVEPEIKKFETSSNHYNLEGTKNKANQLRTGLRSDNPILAVISPYRNISVSSLFNDYVLEREIPCRMETYYDKRIFYYRKQNRNSS